MTGSRMEPEGIATGRDDPFAHPAQGSVRIGTAGWVLPRADQVAFPADGSHLERYAARFAGVEINSSFYRAHRRAVYQRWAASVPGTFRFAVKVPRAITHDQRLIAADVLLDVFMEEVTGLGERLGPLLVQLPPSLAFEADRDDAFFAALRAVHGGEVACEPRHPSWFTSAAHALLVRHRVARVAADPACVPDAALPGGVSSLVYLRLHGSPRMYYSSYHEERLTSLGRTVRAHAASGASTWCMFDNTAGGAATGNALALRASCAGAMPAR